MHNRWEQKNNYSYNRSFKNVYEKKKKSESAIRNSFTRSGMFCEKRLCFGWSVHLTVFLSQYHTDQQLLLYSELKHPHWFKCAVTGEVQGTEGTRRCDLEHGSVSLTAASCPAHSNSALRSFRTVSSFSTDSSYPLLPVSNESFGTKPVKIGKGYASSDLGKHVATFKELKLSFSRD